MTTDLISSMNNWNPLIAVGGAACIFGLSLRSCGKTQDQKSTALLVTTIGIGLLAVGLHQEYSAAEFSLSSLVGEVDPREDRRCYEAMKSVPNEGKIGEMFRAFKRAGFLKKERFVSEKLSKATVISPSQLHSTAHWGFGAHKAHERAQHHLLLRTRLFTEGGVSESLVLRATPSYSGNVNIEPVVDFSERYLKNWIDDFAPKLKLEFEKFLKGESICTENQYSCLQLA